MRKAIKREEDLFHAALKIEAPEERIKFLDRKCANDPDLKRRVLQLIDAAAAADHFFVLATASASQLVKPESLHGK